MREKLIELIRSTFTDSKCNGGVIFADELADHLLANGVVVLMRDKNNFNPDLYCPYCGNNLTSAWEEEQNG